MISVAVDVMSRAFDDGFPGMLAWCDDFPGMVGHGADHDEAIADLVEQIETRTLH